MAVITPEIRMLTGIPVVGDGLVRRTSVGFQPAHATLAFLSHARRPSQRYPQTGLEPGMRQDQADVLDLDNAAFRAGRPGSATGAPGRRMPAPTAGKTACGPWSSTTVSGKRTEIGLAKARSNRGTPSASTRGRRALGS
jgi:hypothetical protein